MLNKFHQKFRNDRLAYLLLSIVLSLLVISVSVESHPPSSMELDYEGADNTLTVQITHNVGNPSNHFVEKISVFKNGEVVLEESYNEQQASNGGDYVYELTAQNGDVIEVKADCNQFGDISKSVDVKGVPETEPVLLQARLTTKTEVQEVKDNTPASASGLVIALLDRENNLLEFSLTYKGLSDRPTGAHFHKGKKGEEGPPVRTIFGEPEIKGAPDTAPEGKKGFISGTWEDEKEQPLTEELVKALLSGEIYVNVHTELNPAGEIRAQLEEVE